MEKVNFKKNDWIKVNKKGEKFWVKIVGINGKVIEGIIDNELIYTESHGLSYKDKIFINIIDIIDVFIKGQIFERFKLRTENGFTRFIFE